MTSTALDPHTLLEKHRERLDSAVRACSTRAYYSAFDESPSPRVYGESAAALGKAAFNAWLGQTFPLDTPGLAGVRRDRALAVRLRPRRVLPPRDRCRPADPRGARGACGPGATPGRRGAPASAWRSWTGLHGRIFELANAVQHTSGQAFVMAFQAGGAHALDRALEAIAYSWTEMTRTPTTALWEKPGRGEPLVMEKTFTVVPRGLALVIGCNTFPTWNSWPGLFASLVCGNPVIVKPHPAAVLPLAITVQVCQEVLEEAGFDPHLVTLAAEGPDDKLAATLAVRPEVKLIDYTGGNAFGDWLEEHARRRRSSRRRPV